MNGNGRRRTGMVLIAGTLLAVASAAFAHDEERVPLATTPHFAFYSDFPTNLNDALIAAGAARKRHPMPVLGSRLSLTVRSSP